MVKSKKKFSAFKLFYDEFIYKENNSVSYANVSRNISKIRDLTMEVRKASKRDLDLYKVKLERNHKRIREQLNEMFQLNPAFFEYYYLLYKACVEMASDRLEDMPLVISCSFYDDYRLDNKSVSSLENSTYAVPKYSSLEKKNIRSDAKNRTRLEYFVYLLETSENRNLYAKFLEKSRILFTIKPVINESYPKFFERIQEDLSAYQKVLFSIEEKAKTTDDYETISEKMQIAYRKKFVDWNAELERILTEHFDSVYNKMKDEKELRGQFNIGNDISFESFMDLSDTLIEEKEQYMQAFENNQFEPVSFADDSYISRFKEVLINSFFDKRYQNSLEEGSSVFSYVDRAIELYGLSSDLCTQIFERILFDASHSSSLKRNNDVRSALIKKIYDLYNPVYLLSIYEKAKDTFLELLAKQDDEFTKKYNLELAQKRLEYDYHGPIPSMQIIKTKLLEKRIRFIEDYCITELRSRDVYGDYDTRNYDLDVVALEIGVPELVELYENLKIKIKTYHYENLCFFDEHATQENYEKEQLLATAQEFIARHILRNLKLDKLSGNELQMKYKDICLGYFNEPCFFLSENQSLQGTEDYNYFLKMRNRFQKNSHWTQLLTYNKIKKSVQ